MPVTNPLDAGDIRYTPGNQSSWTLGIPVHVQQALDMLAEQLAVANATIQYLASLSPANPGSGVEDVPLVISDAWADDEAEDESLLEEEWAIVAQLD